MEYQRPAVDFILYQNEDIITTSTNWYDDYMTNWEAYTKYPDETYGPDTRKVVKDGEVVGFLKFLDGFVWYTIGDSTEWHKSNDTEWN